MMSQQQQDRKLAKIYKIEYETTLDSSLSSSSFSSFTSLSNLLSSPTTRSNNICLHETRSKEKQLFDHQKLNVSIGCFNVFPRLKLWIGSFPLMADLPSLHASMESKKKKLFRLQQREELEREVSVLHKMLEHEQKVHEYLDKLNNRQDGCVLSISNFLPLKMKELLAELAMVENEIMRLERQIIELQDEVKQEKKVDELEPKSKEWGDGTMKNEHETLPLPPNPNIINRRSNEKVTFDTKALHFISKAIKGDYNLSGFSMNDKSVNSKGLSNQKENGCHDEGELFQKKVLKRSSGILKPHTPLREPRNPTPRKDRNLEIHMDISPKVISTPLHSVEDSIQKWAPNKLSENIVKCLIFIFVRLLRTSRAMDFEKSGPITRSTNFSMSFRAETSMISKTSLVSQKDLRQQDPYGIFDLEESIPRDIGPYKNLVRFTSSSIDLKCIQNSSSVPLFQKLKVLMDGLQKVDLRFLSHQQKLAFWINMYNACIMHGFLQYGVPSVSSPEKLLTLINKASLNIAGNTINAPAIENFILRKPADSLVKEIIGKDDKDNKEMIVHELYGLETPDPNIAFALCCGTRSSPAVKIYTADGVTAELERSKLEYLQAAIVVTSTRRIGIPEHLVRNMHDFAQEIESLMEWICHQLPTSGSLRKSIVDCFRGVHSGKTSSAIVEKIPYEFEFQYLLPV